MAMSAQQKNQTESPFFTSFSGHLQQDIKRSRAEQKSGVMVFFGTKHCRFCKRMKTTVLNQNDVQAHYHQYFHSFEFDIESNQAIIDDLGETTTLAQYAKDHRIRLTPTMIFFDPEGHVVYRHVGMIADPQEFLWLSEYVRAGHSQKSSFNAFKMNKRQSKL